MGINGSYVMRTLPLGGWNINGKFSIQDEELDLSPKGKVPLPPIRPKVPS